jgi:hypothetical protein
MTNTTASSESTAVEFAELVEYALRAAERRLEHVKVDALKALTAGDARYLVSWQAESLLKAQAEIEILSAAVAHGPSAIAGLAGPMMLERPTSSDMLSNGVTMARADAARSVLKMFGRYVSAEEVLDRL